MFLGIFTDGTCKRYLVSNMAILGIYVKFPGLFLYKCSTFPFGMAFQVLSEVSGVLFRMHFACLVKFREGTSGRVLELNFKPSGPGK